ncbi:hypothetical protein CHRYSEOSP005_07110 [Chryseobacterium sp. Alg-005]|uniref:hypothetical protein n=1 Tax=Chryseobacterium sp. Alg-005 TaxID=3159516 RepID=UPI0035559C74
MINQKANIVIKTKIKDEVFRKIQSDYDLRKEIADKLNKRESAIYNLANRKSNGIANYFIVILFKALTGWSDDEMFEEQISSKTITNDKRNKSRKGTDNTVSA